MSAQSSRASASTAPARHSQSGLTRRADILEALRAASRARQQCSRRQRRSCHRAVATTGYADRTLLKDTVIALAKSGEEVIPLRRLLRRVLSAREFTAAPGGATPRVQSQAADLETDLAASGAAALATALGGGRPRRRPRNPPAGATQSLAMTRPSLTWGLPPASRRRIAPSLQGRRAGPGRSPSQGWQAPR